MKKGYTIVFTSIFLLLLISGLHAQQVKSPDGNLILSVSISDSIRFSAGYKGHPVIKSTAIAMKLDNGMALGFHPEKLSDSITLHKGTVTAVVPNKDRFMKDEYRELSIWFKSDYSVQFRIYNEGIAYRFLTQLYGRIIVQNEIMELTFPAKTTSLFPQEKSMYSHFERAYLLKSLDTIPGKSFCSLPVLFTTSDSIRVLFTEADLYDYPCMFLRGTGTDMVKPTFPKFVLEALPDPKRTDRSEILSKQADYIAQSDGNRSFPWRVFIITDDDRKLVESNLVFKLSRPLAIADTTWIKPGKVAWDWYNANNIFDVDFPSGINTATYKYYIDFASKYGLEYVILDEGWTKSTVNVLESNPEMDIPALIAYGKSKSVGIICWLLWKPLDGNEEKIMSTYEAWGVKGIKVDFMQRADQAMVNSYEKIARIAAKHHLLVDFHGAFKPSGLSRAYPNVLSHEGVRGNENNKWSDYANPRHNVTLPFTRMVAGPMDYTPGAMRNAQKSDFTISFNTPMSLGTRCHQVAMYIIYESPIQMLCDLPTLYLKDGKTVDFISKIPTV
ncbi:MAG: glycoside hydrolase family 97 catalytic domain-containing protein [Bacteroidota bacterium]